MCEKRTKKGWIHTWTTRHELDFYLRRDLQKGLSKILPHKFGGCENPWLNQVGYFILKSIWKR